MVLEDIVGGIRSCGRDTAAGDSCVLHVRVPLHTHLFVCPIDAQYHNETVPSKREGLVNRISYG